MICQVAKQSPTEPKMAQATNIEAANKPQEFTYQTKYGPVVLLAQNYRHIFCRGNDLVFPRNTICNFFGHFVINQNGFATFVNNQGHELRKRDVPSWESWEKRIAPQSYRDKFYPELTDIVNKFIKEHPEQFKLSVDLWVNERINQINERIEELESEIHRLRNGIELGNKAKTGGWDDRVKFNDLSLR